MEPGRMLGECDNHHITSTFNKEPSPSKRRLCPAPNNASSAPSQQMALDTVGGRGNEF